VAIHGVHHVFHPPVQMNAWPKAIGDSRIVLLRAALNVPRWRKLGPWLQDRVLLE